MTRRYRKKAKLNTRVDFTPMVDMMMLLLTFFMFCTTLSRPQVMDLAIPTSDIPTGTPPDTGSEAITLLLADNKTIYYYEGVADYEDYASLKKISYGELRNVLVNKNRQIVQQVNELAKRKNEKGLSEEDYKKAVSEAKRNIKGTVAVIKPMEESVFQNLVDVLDEMAICSVGRYAIVEVTDGDDFLIKNFESKGLYAQENSVSF